MRNFTWENFSFDFIKKVVYSPATKKDLKPKRIIEDKILLMPNMDRIALRPTREFIMKYRWEIESGFLAEHPELVLKIGRDLKLGRNANYRSVLNILSKSEMGNSLISCYESALFAVGNPNFQYEQPSPFRRRQIINLNESKKIDNELYDFQKIAVDKLGQSLIGDDKQNGLLVMPTGSGKTRTAVEFLLENMVSRGYQIVWLAHRHMLLDQSASAFRDLSPLVKKRNSNAKELRIICVSGIHSSIRATEKTDDIIIISTQSGYRGLDYISRVLKKRVMIVVDEAHHTCAPTYQRIINCIRGKRKDAKLLGLTATPIRRVDSESKLLHKMFDNNIIYEIPMAELITKNILAVPKFERIETNENFESIISTDEAKLIRRFRELPETVISKIADSARRNKVIVDTYIKNKERYGKTLIFALNGIHAFTLNEELKKNGINSDYIYSGNEDNHEKISRFKNKDGKLDVLININILTEGTDIPNIETIFLTRPTQSEGLLMQMIGRGMRGTEFSGTEEVNIVDFCDKWLVFNKWLNPQWIFGDDLLNGGTQVRNKSKTTDIPWKVIANIYDNIDLQGDYQLINDEGLPFGWYSIYDFDDNEYTMLVWANQLSAFRKIIRDKKEITEKNLSSKSVIEKYFSNFTMPPKMEDLDIFLYNIKTNFVSPKLFRFDERNDVDHIKIYKQLVKDNIGINDIKTKVKEIYEENNLIIDNIYGGFDIYYMSIVNQLTKTEGYTHDPHIEEMPLELLPYEIKPTHDLEELMEEVINEMFEGHYGGIHSITWTRTPVTGFYGMYYPTGHIQINKLLDSPQVDKEVVKFLIYHELLHRDYRYHDKDFYREEHKYPNYIDHNMFLDGGITNYNLTW